MPRLLSLFDGTGSICKPFLAAGWECERVDIDGSHGATVVADILTWDYFQQPVPDVVWAGVPCEQYSQARTRAKKPRDFAKADALVAKAWEIISHFLALNAQLQYFIENPDQSLLWGRRVADPFPHRVRLSYCQYPPGPGYRKNTKLATNSSYQPRPMCDRRTCSACVDGRHAKTAQRGPCRRDGARMQGDDCSLDTLHAYPEALCQEIFEHVRGSLWEVL